MYAKENIYLAWMQKITKLIFDKDITDLYSNKQQNVTASQLRTVYNYGYKMAMLEVQQNLNQSNAVGVNLNLNSFIEDKLQASDCLEHLKEISVYIEDDTLDGELKAIHMYLYSKKRSDQFQNSVLESTQAKFPIK